MPTSKLKAKAQTSKSISCYNLGLSDPFPESLLDFLSAFPQETDEPPRKRAKLEETAEPEHVVIAKETLVVSRPCRHRAMQTHPDLSFECPNIGHYIALRYSTEDERKQILGISSKPQAVTCELILGHAKLAKPLFAVLNVACSAKDEKALENGLWTTIDVAFERRGATDHLKLIFTLNWNLSTNIYQGFRTAKQRVLSGQVLAAFFSRQASRLVDAPDSLSPQAFYEGAFTPNADYPGVPSAMVPHLESTLYPFQGRALQWLMNREGAQWTPDKGVESLVTTRPVDLPLSFIEAEDVNGRPYYISNLLHVVTREIGPFRDLAKAPGGGILAEEMGLGKTVETISLILMHRRPPHPNIMFDLYTRQDVRPIGTTLIVTPMTLKKQWQSEFQKHAPELRVMVYEGLKKYKGSMERIEKELAENDVVITTYNVLQAEIHYAELPPDRTMRHERQQPRRTSPLRKFSWWRVCLDEAQQIESGVSNAAKVARLIPRVNAWGITGTPVKENIKDLWGLLLFLRHEPYASFPLIWNAITSTHKDMFKALFNQIALRHSKRAVRRELLLPPQKRYVITMPFTAVEEQYYQSQFTRLARDCGLDSRGVPIADGWDPDHPATLELMRRALAQLRQTVLHPELGPNSLRTLAQRNKPLRTIEEVLETMIEQAGSSIKTDQRLWITSKLDRGQLLENSPRVKEALAIWEEALKELRNIVKECRKQLQVEMENAKEAETVEASKAEADSGDEESEEDRDSSRLGDARRNLRYALDLEHKAVFFIASAQFQIKSNVDMTEPDSEEFKRLEKLEVEGYELAKQIRKEILQEAYAKASSYMAKLQKNAKSQSFAEMPPFKPISHKGIESRRVLESLEELCGILDEQANLIDDWRESVIQLLLRPLVDEEGEAEITGEEYEDSTKIQEELMVYTHVLRAAIGDRQDALTGLVNQRVKHETKFAERLAKEGSGPAPEKMLELLALRLDSKPTGSLRGTVTHLRELATKFRHDSANGNNRAKIELEIVQEHLTLTQEQISEQTKAATALEKELDLFTSAMNARVDYYRQLQAVSDSVAPRDLPRSVNLALVGHVEYEALLLQKITTAQSKHRYLLHLQEKGQNSQEPKLCIICRESFTVGVLTICGHEFCKECLMLWFKAQHTCPVCKKRLTLSMLHDITLKKQELKVHTEERAVVPHESTSPHKSRKSAIYSEFGAEKLRKIRDIELDGPSFATKVDTMIRHIMWLRHVDPGAKCIIFSQFKGFLDFLGHAFEQFRIGFTTFDRPDGIARFKEDPAVECFLMDARAHASGLNLVNASHVFLCEPMLNTALELQAIARVDRIGQQHETTVWLYLVEGTVEESIYNLSVQRRMEHMGQDYKGKTKEQAPEVPDLFLEAANSMELQQASLSKLMNKDKQLGEVVDKNDLWECLFGHVSRETTASQAPQVLDDRFSDAKVVGFLAGEAAENRRRRGEANESPGGPSNAA